MELANILSERLETQERGIRKLKTEKNFRGAMPPDPLGACVLGARLGNRSVFILDPRLFLTYFVVRRGRFLSWKKNDNVYFNQERKMEQRGIFFCVCPRENDLAHSLLVCRDRVIFN